MSEKILVTTCVREAWSEVDTNKVHCILRGEME